MMKKDKNTCDPCQQDFKKEVDHLVDEVKDYTRKDHEKKEKEVEEAFAKKDSHKK